MKNRYLLDTNVIIDILRGKEDVLEKIKNLDNIYISVISVGELFYGAMKSRKKKVNIEKLKELFSEIPAVECDYKTAELYGKIKVELEKSGTPIPENDIWISAIALKNKMILITSDPHFDKVKTLKNILKI